MGRWTQYDEDSYRLPSGFKRVGYDADTGQYVFQSASGDTWNGAPHETYGNMHRTSPPAWSNTSSRALDNNSSTADSASTPEKSKPAFRRQLSLRFLNVARSSGTKEGKEEIPSNSAGPNMFARTAQTVVRRMRSFSVPASAVGKRHTLSNEEKQLAPSSYTSERKVETVKRSATLTGPSGKNKNPGSENETARPTHSGNGSTVAPSEQQSSNNPAHRSRTDAKPDLKKSVTLPSRHPKPASDPPSSFASRKIPSDQPTHATSSQSSSANEPPPVPPKDFPRDRKRVTSPDSQL